MGVNMKTGVSTLILVVLLNIDARVYVATLNGGSKVNDLPCFTCEHQAEDTNYCISKRYAHPYICCMYIECNSTCGAYEMTCDSVPGNNQQLLYFSYPAQTCISPSESSCYGTSSICEAIETGTTVQTSNQTQTTTLAPTTAAGKSCQFMDKSPVNAAYDLSKQVAFNAIKTTDFQSQNPLAFDVLLLDVNSKFVLSNGTLPPRAGTYFFHSSFGIPRTTTCYSYLYGGSTYLGGIERSANNNDGIDTVSRDYVYTLSASQYARLSTSSTGYSDSLGQTSWLGFRVDDLFEPLSVFSQVNTADYIKQGIIEFNSSNVDLGSDWDNTGTQDHYAVPTSGLYFLTLTTAANPGVAHTVAICVNGRIVGELRSTTTNNVGTEVFTRSLARYLTVGDDVTAWLTSGTLHSSPTYKTIAFQGFLYSPVHGIQIIWSVHTQYSAVGPMDPVPFEYLLLNEGGAWRAQSRNVCVPRNGVYYLHVNAATDAYTSMNVQLRVNGVPQFDIRRDATHANGVNTHGRAFIARLSLGDIVHVSLLSGTMYSNGNIQSSFTGFLLYPE